MGGLGWRLGKRVGGGRWVRGWGSDAQFGRSSWRCLPVGAVGWVSGRRGRLEGPLGGERVRIGAEVQPRRLAVETQEGLCLNRLRSLRRLYAHAQFPVLHVMCLGGKVDGLLQGGR